MSEQVDGVIYLRAQPETCFARCQKRNRSEESSISLEYLKTVHQKHEDWLATEEKSRQQLTLDLDGNILTDLSL